MINNCNIDNKKEILRKFPDVTFIWKYEKPEDKISEGIPNLIVTTWVPQNDMLCEFTLHIRSIHSFSDDPRLSLFITHCGQGSTTEATTAGIPLIVIPVLADQKRNAAVGLVSCLEINKTAQVINRIGTGIVLEKEALEHPDELQAAIREALTNKM